MRIIFAFSIALLSFIELRSQTPAQFNSSKFKLHIPDNWKGQRSLIKRITDIAPLIFTELKNKQMCLNCEGSYSIQFFYDSLWVESQVPITLGAGTSSSNINSGVAMSNYECVTTYHFRGTFKLFDKDKTQLAEIVLVTTSENQLIKNKFSIATYASYSPNDPMYSKTKQPALNPDNNPYNHCKGTDGSHIKINNLLGVLEKKIWELPLKT